MKRTGMIILASVFLVTPAFAQSVGEKTGVNTVLGIAPATGDFVKQVAMSDMFEIASNKIAQEKGNAAEKYFATQMIADHTKTSTELKNLNTGKFKAQIPAALDAVHQSKIDKLESATERDFSSAFRTAQVDAHKDAVDLFERYAKSGDDADLKTWANGTLPALKHHLEMA